MRLPPEAAALAGLEHRPAERAIRETRWEQANRRICCVDATLSLDPRDSVAKSRRIRHFGRRGFSLMEMILCIVIIGIMGAMFFPQVSNLTRKNAVARAAQLVQQDLQRAYTLAGRLRKPVTLTADNTNHAYQVTDASNNILLSRNLGVTQEYGVETMTFYPTTVTIQPNGVSSDTLGVTLVSRGSTRYVSMTRVGLIRRTQ
jgi:prepilin-type N-terminal cleavage/methylation domain-containing protein